MKYNAFISYSHSDCGNIAPSIQRALENIGKPWYQLKRNLNIFRDETNLTASPELWNSIVTELDNSDNLILLASPIAKDSHWVNKEVEYWFSKKRKGDLFIVLAEGNIIWDYSINDFDWEKTNCLPKTMIGKFKTEPLWIDLSEYINAGRESINYKQAGFTSSLTKIIGRIVGKPPREIESDELSRKRKTNLVLVFSIVLFTILLALGYVFYTQKEINRRNSVANNLIAEGNKYSESNINKALLLYGYAYSISSDKSAYNILNNFYTSYTNYELNTFVDSINLFHSKKILQRSEQNLEIKYILDSLKLLNNSEPYLQNKNDSQYYFETDIKIQIKNLKKQNELEDVSFYITGDRYNFILLGKYLYVFLYKMHEGDADYYLDYVESQPLFKLQLLYNDSLEKNIIKMGEYHNWEEDFTGIYFDKVSRKLYILAKKQPWINPNTQKTHYELYTFDLFNSYKLTKDKNHIMIEILKNNGQIDLPDSDKRNLNIFE